MKKRVFILVALISSLILHLLLIMPVSLYIREKGTPVIYCWQDVISEKDLFSSRKEVSFPQGVNFSFNDLRKDYFSTTVEQTNFLSSYNDTYASGIDKTPSFVSLNNQTVPAKAGLIYLWEKPVGFESKNEEVIPYKVLISPQGKVIFSYPQKLSANSEGSLYLQEYIRESALFLDDKLFWTKLEGVVK